jgi:hypothetical protein
MGYLLELWRLLVRQDGGINPSGIVPAEPRRAPTPISYAALEALPGYWHGRAWVRRLEASRWGNVSRERDRQYRISSEYEAIAEKLARGF